MSELTQTIGLRLRGYRLERGHSQETLAELAGLHPTYVGQVERGEKNVTVDSLAKITTALNIPLSRLFEVVEEQEAQDNYPRMSYELLTAQPKSVQGRMYRILREIEGLRENP